MGPRLFSRGNIAGIMTEDEARKLQWGHDFSAVEIVILKVTMIDHIPASMGPRLFSRGNANIVPLDTDIKIRFNGATTFQPWKWRPFFGFR